MKILIVDDHALIREGLALLLPRLDARFDSIGVGSCREALDTADTRRDIDLVLMDLSLPDAPLGEGIVQFRERHPELPIVAVSGTQDRETVLKAIREGAMGFIPKSYSGERLFGALQYILVYKGTFLPPEIFLDSSSALAASNPPQSQANLSKQRTEPRSLGLTDRQAAVLQLVLQGKANKVIARQLGIEDTTVRAHVTAVLRALNVTTRTEAVVAAHKLGLVFPTLA